MSEITKMGEVEEEYHETEVCGIDKATEINCFKKGDCSNC
jgi:hypothetical protein